MDTNNFEKLLIVLKETWEKLYQVTFKQVYIDQIESTVYLLIGLLVLGFILWFINKTIKWERTYKEYDKNTNTVNETEEKLKEAGLSYLGSTSYDEEAFAMIMAISGFATIILLIIILVHIPGFVGNIVTLINNPDWLVLEKLLYLVQQ